MVTWYRCNQFCSRFGYREFQICHSGHPSRTDRESHDKFSEMTLDQHLVDSNGHTSLKLRMETPDFPQLESETIFSNFVNSNWSTYNMDVVPTVVVQILQIHFNVSCVIFSLLEKLDFSGY